MESCYYVVATRTVTGYMPFLSARKTLVSIAFIQEMPRCLASDAIFLVLVLWWGRVPRVVASSAVIVRFLKWFVGAYCLRLVVVSAVSWVANDSFLHIICLPYHFAESLDVSFYQDAA